MLHDLKDLHFSAGELEKVPDLVYTVRKVSSKVIPIFKFVSTGPIHSVLIGVRDNLVPRPTRTPSFQCCALKSGKVWCLLKIMCVTSSRITTLSANGSL